MYDMTMLFSATSLGRLCDLKSDVTLWLCGTRFYRALNYDCEDAEKMLGISRIASPMILEPVMWIKGL